MDALENRQRASLANRGVGLALDELDSDDAMHYIEQPCSLGNQHSKPEAKNRAEVSNMTFTWLNKQGVRGSSGFELQREDRFTMTYREESNVITFEIENGIVGCGKYAVLLSPDALTRWDDGRPINEDKQKQVLGNIRDALAFQDLALSVE